MGRPFVMGVLFAVAPLLVACDNQAAEPHRTRGDPGSSAVHHAGPAAAAGPVGQLDWSALPENGIRTLEPSPILVLGPEDPAGEWYFAEVRDARFTPGGEIAVLDSQHQHVRLFDLEGRLLRTIGRPGSGPGEFRALRGVVARNDGALATWDAGEARVTVFGTGGEDVQTIPVSLPMREGWIVVEFRGLLPDGSVLFEGRERASAQGSVEPGAVVRPARSFVRFTPGDEGWTAIAEAPGPGMFHGWRAEAGTAQSAALGIPIISPPVLTVRGASPLVISRNRGVATVLDVNGDTLEVVDLGIQRMQTSRELVRELQERIQRSIEANVRPGRTAVPDAGERLADALPELLPALHHAFVGAGGLLWLGAYLPPGTDEETRLWYVVDEDWAPLRRIELPRTMTPLHASGGLVLVRRTDEVGLPRLEVHRVAGGA